MVEICDIKVGECRSATCTTAFALTENVHMSVTHFWITFLPMILCAIGSVRYLIEMLWHELKAYLRNAIKPRLKRSWREKCTKYINHIHKVILEELKLKLLN